MKFEAYLTLHQKNVCTYDLCQHIPSNCISLYPKILKRCWGFNHTFNITWGISVSISFLFFLTLSQKRSFLLLTLFSPEVSVSAFLRRTFFTVLFTAGDLRRVIAVICGVSEELQRESKDRIFPVLLHWAEKNGRQDFSQLQKKYGISLNTCRICVF